MCLLDKSVASFFSILTDSTDFWFSDLIVFYSWLWLIITPRALRKFLPRKLWICYVNISHPIYGIIFRTSYVLCIPYGWKSFFYVSCESATWISRRMLSSYWWHYLQYILCPIPYEWKKGFLRLHQQTKSSRDPFVTPPFFLK